MRYLLSLLTLLFIANITATTIYDIQYTTIPGDDGTYPSLFVGQQVTVEGIVTAIGMSGDNYFISEPSGGEWSGIFVFDNNTMPLPGDLVSVQGTVTEHFGLTELSNVSGTIISSDNPLPNPIVIPTGSFALPGIAEKYECVLSATSRITVISEFNEFNQYEINDGSGACLVDDYLYGGYVPVVGHLLDIIGIVYYSYDEFKILPRNGGDILPYGTSNKKKSWGRIKSIYK